jgi:hypothetical protein
MQYRRNPSQHLTLGRCAEEARKYRTRTEFAHNSTGFYIKARRKGWLDEICGHMEDVYQTWTKDACAAEAAKYANRSDFFRKNPRAYSAALNNGWLDDVTTKLKKAFETHRQETEGQVERLDQVFKLLEFRRAARNARPSKASSTKPKSTWKRLRMNRS